jgi:hypothetical protein
MTFRGTLSHFAPQSVNNFLKLFFAIAYRAGNQCDVYQQKTVDNLCPTTGLLTHGPTEMEAAPRLRSAGEDVMV